MDSISKPSSKHRVTLRKPETAKDDYSKIEALSVGISRLQMRNPLAFELPRLKAGDLANLKKDNLFSKMESDSRGERCRVHGSEMG